jgi:hypothetical protein
MKILLWVFLISICISLVSEFFRLAAGNYPRTVTYKSWHDVVLMLINLVLAVWIFIVLFGHNYSVQQ